MLQQRTVNLLLSMLGLTIVAVLALMGMDIVRAAKTGPQWKRRLVGAGLAMLALFGVPAYAQTADAPPPVTREAEPVSKDLSDSTDWKVITDAWATAMPLAESGKGTEVQREAADKQLNVAKEAVKRLAAAGLLAAQEADLLTGEAGNIREDIYRNPPTDFQAATCYKMDRFIPAEQSFERLSKRLPLVEKLVTGGKVHPAACAKIIAVIEADLKVLSDEKQMRELSEEADREKAAKIREDVKTKLADLKAQVEKAK